MGGEGSGRRPDPMKAFNLRMNPQPNPQPMDVTGEFIIPNVSAVKQEAIKGSDTSFLTAGDNVSLLTNDSGYYTSGADVYFDDVRARNVYGLTGDLYLANNADSDYINIGTSDIELALGGGAYQANFTTDGLNFGAGQVLITSGANIEATGYISGAYIWGDGSNLTNLPAGTETDPLFMALSGNYLTTETDPLFMALSGNYLTTETDPIWIATSGAYATTAYVELVSGAAVKTETDPIWAATSGSYTTLVYTELVSGALATHTADSSDPHGATLTQTTALVTNLSLTTSGACSADQDASGQAIFRNILVGTEGTPGPASLYPQGTIYLKYTA